MENIENIEIEKITTKDIDQLQKIGIHTFYETYATNNTEENMQNYLTESFSTNKLINELNDENTEFYFVKIDKNIIGYLKLNFGTSQTELKNEKSLEIERIYVLKDFHGKNVGQILLNRAIDIAKQKNFDFVWLSVWEENPRAFNFYKKNGFIAFDKHIFTLGQDKLTDIMMKLNLHI